jgi:hypothetical protein
MSGEGEASSLLSTVWMIHAYTGARTGVRGQLSFDGDNLRFQPHPGQRGGEVEVALSDIGSVKVPFGSPVLQLEFLTHPLGEVLFYFVETPFMYGRPTQFTLATANAIIRDDILAWESAIRQAQGVGPS